MDWGIRGILFGRRLTTVDGQFDRDLLMGCDAAETGSNRTTLFGPRTPRTTLT